MIYLGSKLTGGRDVVVFKHVPELVNNVAVFTKITTDTPARDGRDIIEKLTPIFKSKQLFTKYWKINCFTFGVELVFKNYEIALTTVSLNPTVYSKHLKLRIKNEKAIKKSLNINPNNSDIHKPLVPGQNTRTVPHSVVIDPDIVKSLLLYSIRFDGIS